MAMWVKRKALNLTEQQKLLEDALNIQNRRISYLVSASIALSVGQAVLTYIIFNVR